MWSEHDDASMRSGSGQAHDSHGVSLRWKHGMAPVSRRSGQETGHGRPGV
jgi:hypothetical protein